jgi:hypothetical protein
MGAISSVNVLGNSIGVEHAQELITILQAKEKLITLCGFSGDETELDLSNKNWSAGCAVLVANEIIDNGALSVLSFKNNRLLTKEAGNILSDMLSANTALKELDLSSNNWGKSYDLKGDGPGFAQELSVGIKDNGALSVLSMKSNSLGVEGAKALAEGLKGNSVITELNIANNDLANYGRDMSGVIILADVIKDMGALLHLDISNNHNGKLVSSGGWVKADEPYPDYTYKHPDGRHQKEPPEDEHFKAEGAIAIANVIKDLRALSKLIWGGDYWESPLDGWTTPDPVALEVGMTEADFSNKGLQAAGAIIVAAWLSHKDKGALSSLDLSRNSIGTDGVAFITAALKMHAIEHQGPCIGIRLGDQDQHFLARTKLKDLRALLVATSNLDPPHGMPAISAYLLKEIAEWL